MSELNMKAVCRLTGLNSSTLRAWERRYGAVEPLRSATGRRLYRYRDVERLKLMARLVSQGHSIGNIARLTDSGLNGLLEVGLEESENQELEGSNSQIEAHMARLLEQLKAYKVKGLSLQLAQIRNQFNVRSFVLDFISPLLGQVGEQVRLGNLSIAQEHVISAILRAQLGQIMQGMVTTPLSDANSPRFLFATPEGELHEFGIILSALLCGYWGFEVNYVGPNLPAEPLAEATTALAANYIVLGTSPFTNDLHEYVIDLDRKLSDNGTEILVGGPCSIDLENQGFQHLVRPISKLQDLDVLFQTLSHNGK